MKPNKTLLIAALSLLAASGLMAKPQTKEEIPGMAAQPASFFYTGKPYDADLGAYTFNYRNYDPSTARWTTVDPSGFPDGVNNHIYTNQPLSNLDPDGNSTTPITLRYVWNPSNGTQTTVTWKGNFVWSFDATTNKMVDHSVVAVEGFEGTVRPGLTFESSDSSSTCARDPRSADGKNNYDVINLHCQLVLTIDNNRTITTYNDCVKVGNYYE